MENNTQDKIEFTPTEQSIIALFEGLYDGYRLKYTKDNKRTILLKSIIETSRLYAGSVLDEMAKRAKSAQSN